VRSQQEGRVSQDIYIACRGKSVSSEAAYGTDGVASSFGMAFRRSTWWARANAEQPLNDEKACPRQGCEKSIVSPFDLYCREGEADSNEFHFVVGGTDRRLQTIAIYAARAVFGLLALLAARSGSRIPLDVGAGLAGGLILALPLRRFAVARSVAPIAWICIFVLTVAAHEGWLSAHGEDLSITVILGIAVCGLVLAVLAHEGEPSVRLLHRGVAGGLVVALGAGLLFAAFELGLGTTSGPLREASLLVAVAALGSVLGGMALTGFVIGFREVKTNDIEPHRAPQLKRPPRAHFGDPPPPSLRSFFARVAHVVRVAMVRLINGCAEVAYRALRMAVDAVNVTIRLALQLEFVIRLSAWWALRLLGRATLDAIEALRIAAGIVGAVALRWTTCTMLGLGLLAGAAQLATLAARLFESYLGGSTLLDGVGAPVLAVAAGAMLVAVWWAVTKWPIVDVVRSALHSIGGAGPSLFLTLVALGWIDGIAGLLGFGPIRPGLLTVGGTLILLVGGGYVLARERRRPGESHG
jgi:hypothetical protein